MHNKVMHNNHVRAVVLSLLIVRVAYVAYSYGSGAAWTHWPRVDQPAPVSVSAARARGARASRPARRP